MVEPGPTHKIPDTSEDIAVRKGRGQSAAAAGITEVRRKTRPPWRPVPQQATALTALSTPAWVRPLTITFAPPAASPLAAARPIPARRTGDNGCFSGKVDLHRNSITSNLVRHDQRACAMRILMSRLPPIRQMSYGNIGVRHLWMIGTFVTLNLCASAISAEPVVRRTGAPWPDTLLSRVEALALIETLNARLLGACCTATEVLDKWCADHKLASDPVIHARRISGTEKPVSPEQRQRLQVGPEEEVTYRHVELTCGGHVLVEADNWYVPRRVGAEINRVLTTTDTPFGRAVRDLKPNRKNFSVEILWKPLPDGWEQGLPPADRTRGHIGNALAAFPASRCHL